MSAISRFFDANAPLNEIAQQIAVNALGSGAEFEAYGDILAEVLTAALIVAEERGRSSVRKVRAIRKAPKCGPRRRKHKPDPVTAQVDRSSDVAPIQDASIIQFRPRAIQCADPLLDRVRDLVSQRMSQRQIADALGISRPKVQRMLARILSA